VRKLITSRLAKAPATKRKGQRISADSLVRAYQRHTDKQRALLRRAECTKDRMLLLVTALKRLFADEHFTTLLRAEGLETIPEHLAQQITT
jgi:ParB family chromosome partitioning protein